MLWGMRRGDCVARQTVNRAMASIGAHANRPMEPPMRKPKQGKPLNDLSRSLTTLDANHTLVAVIEMGQKTQLCRGILPCVERQPLKKLDTDENALLKLFERWRMEAEKAGHKIKRITVAFEAAKSFKSSACRTPGLKDFHWADVAALARSRWSVVHRPADPGRCRAGW